MAKRRSKPKNSGRVSETALENPDVIDTVVFRSGNSDAVRLPKRFGLVGKTVRVRREGDARIVIEVRAKRSWPAGFFERFGGKDYGFRMPPREPPNARDEERLNYVIEAFRRKDR
jgi:virulence-associated protein VagC